MSRRSILLTTTMCMALASTAAIDPASAHNSGGGGSYHSAGSGNVHAFPVSKTATAPRHNFKPGNGVTRSTAGQVPAPIYTGSIAVGTKARKIPSSAFPPADPSPNSPIGPAPTVLNKPVGPGAKVSKGAPAPWLWVPSVPY